jgi:CheY-like chemotaxis protein
MTVTSSAMASPTVTAATVLVVDDLPDMRMLARAVLERAGLRVGG